MALLLAGATSYGAFLNYCSSRSISNLCVEEPVLEYEDGCNAPVQLDLAQPTLSTLSTQSSESFDVAVGARIELRSAERSGHPQRGPPNLSRRAMLAERRKIQG